MSDNKGNTFTKYVEHQRSNNYVGIWYAYNATCGTGHTITISGSGNYPALIAYAFSGVQTSPAPTDGSNFADTFAATIQPGSVTPTGSDDLFITAAGGDGSGNLYTSVDSGFTQFGTNYGWLVPGSNGSLSAAYKIKSGSSSAENPTWSHTNNNAAAVQAAFLAAAGGGGGATTKKLAALGVG